MILGVSHVVAATAAPALQPYIEGWGRDFLFEDCPVPTGRPSYLSTPRVRYDFALFHPPIPGPGVELVRYGGTSGYRGRYHLAFGFDAGAEVAAAARSAMVASTLWPETDDVDLVGKLDCAPSAVGFTTPDLEASIKFWVAGLGFSLVKLADGQAILRSPGLLRNWHLEIVLVAGNANAPRDGMLDDSGWNCLTILAHRLNAASERALSNGGRNATERLKVPVGNRALDLLFMRGPGGEVIELLDGTSVMKGGRVVR